MTHRSSCCPAKQQGGVKEATLRPASPGCLPAKALRVLLPAPFPFLSVRDFAFYCAFVLLAPVPLPSWATRGSAPRTAPTVRGLRSRAGSPHCRLTA